MNQPLDEEEPRTKSNVRLGAGWMWLLLLIGLMWLFYPGLLQSQIPAFRDAYHFYYPQAVWLDRCAEQGNYFPVWNPEEGLGVSMAGQPSAALYYPLRILWLTPGMNVAQRFSLFISAHVLIAAAGMRFAAGKLGLSEDTRWLAAISFSLSCPVFFQHHNPIFLCSAAWIGFAGGAVFHSLSHANNRLKDWGIFAIACSMMLLAGDPHSAVNSFIVGVCVLGVSGIVYRDRESKCDKLCLRSRLAFAGWWMFCAGLLFVALTAVQWIPAARLAERSSRMEATSGELGASPVAVSRLAVSRLGESSDGGELGDDGLPKVSAILKTNEPPKHRIYDFSLSPWHLATPLWPTLGGNYLPHNSRIFATLPAEGRMWIPSLYFGCLPCLLVLTALVRKKKSRVTQRLMGIAGFSLFAASGSYTPVWLLREILKSLGMIDWAKELPLDPVSGLYWLLCSTIPTYELFRYPAKWTVWLVAACSLLAAHQLSNYPATGLPHISQNLRRGVLVLSTIGCMASILVGWSAMNSTALDTWLANAAPDVWLGPPEARAVAMSLCIAFAVPLCVATLNVAANHIALITLAEMTLCAGCWVSFVPPPVLSDQLAVELENRQSDSIFVWANHSEADIQQDIPIIEGKRFAQTQADYQRTFALGKIATIAGVRSLSASQSIEPASLAALRSWLSKHDRMSANQPELDQALAELSVTHRLIRQRWPDRKADFKWQPIPNPRPMCQLVGDQVIQAHVVQDPENQDIVIQRVDGLVSWQWLNSDSLEVQINTAQQQQSSAVKLLIRQLNDGGWIARNESGEELTIAPGQLFVVIPLVAGESFLRLTRKWLW